MIQVDTWLHYDPFLLLGDNTLTAPLKIYSGGFSNDPRNFLNFDECTISIEGNSCGDIDTQFNEITL